MACRCGAIRLCDEDLQVRIGIHLGEIDRRGDDVSGIAVNIAARIMASAEPGQILNSGVVAQTANAVSFTMPSWVGTMAAYCSIRAQLPPIKRLLLACCVSIRMDSCKGKL